MGDFNTGGQVVVTWRTVGALVEKRGEQLAGLDLAGFAPDRPRLAGELIKQLAGQKDFPDGQGGSIGGNFEA